MHGDTSYSVEHTIFESIPRLRKVSLSNPFVWNGLSGSWAQLGELNAGYASYGWGLSSFSAVCEEYLEAKSLFRPWDCRRAAWSFRLLPSASLFACSGDNSRNAL